MHALSTQLISESNTVILQECNYIFIQLKKLPHNNLIKEKYVLCIVCHNILKTEIKNIKTNIFLTPYKVKVKTDEQFSLHDN